MYGRNLKAYNRTKLEAELLVASPHRVTQMLFEGLIERLNQAKGHIETRDPAKKAEFIGKAMGILNGLQGAVDPSYDPELGNRIIGLYDYMKDRLNDANINDDIGAIDEIIRLITPIKEAWDNIPDDIKEEQNKAITEKFESIDEQQRERNRKGYAYD
ncbi:MAG: flagellar export chaperone FliS [Anaerobiospirillum succiniciproducens]|uniref:flagellar export chaperone FliS n=1 Tax=Anaerobiospirillum succiniciproducens TaxID=13335 RepID=UPI0004296F0E|nr:flagellar export chaperone FliS [Anaerobiospirillum succiniciproducens]MCI6862626.1 flagellar export chaperone FliS [Anaerobiospirillum succiniciproducens]MDO4676516.1 flagellar export chaperone FliS [Anaerobiospirillum succiniciproducens]MDY2797684.1 flagellar export chaperone FliS [Anaerobiospirillum succiniciproducens]